MSLMKLGDFVVDKNEKSGEFSSNEINCVHFFTKMPFSQNYTGPELFYTNEATKLTFGLLNRFLIFLKTKFAICRKFLT